MQAPRDSLPEPNVSAALAFAAVGVLLPLIFAPIAWLYARDQRRLVASGDLRDTRRGWLRASEALGATMTLLVALVLAAALISAGSGAFQ